ncbi:MAG: CPBP family intramembrane glutamic endopeptidase [bacterium]
MSYSKDETRRRLPLYYLAALVAGGLIFLLPRPGLLTDLSLWPALPAWIVLSHLLVGGSYVITSLKLRRGYTLAKSSLAVYGKLASITHLQAAILIAVAEELIFRYALLFWLARILGSPWIALLITSVAFALAHVPTFLKRSGKTPGALRLIDMFLFALVLGGLTLWTRSLYPALIAHAMRNYILRCLLISREEYVAMHLDAMEK